MKGIPISSEKQAERHDAPQLPGSAAWHNIFIGLFVMAVTMLFSGCNREEREALLAVDYAGWEGTTDLELDYPIPGHEDNYRKIYINRVGTGLQISTKEGKVRHTYPTGTIILKEVFPGLEYQEGSEPMMLTAMVKLPSDPAARGGWVWVVKDMATGTETVMETKFCVTCHANANESHPYGDGNPEGEFRDYVFFPYRLSNGKEDIE